MLRLLLCTLLMLGGVVYAMPPEQPAYVRDPATGRFAVPLTIKDNAGVARSSWPVSTGVPLPVGAVRDTAELSLTDAAGRPIPVQFTVLSRYAARDNSLRWVLLDFQVDVPANGTVTVVLRNDASIAAVPAEPVRVDELADTITVRTGSLEAVVPRHAGSLLQSVRLDGRLLLAAAPGDGPVLRSGAVRRMERFRGNSWNTHGWEKTRSEETLGIVEALYHGGPPRDAVVEMAGPLRAVVRLRGRHVSRQPGEGILADGLYDYTVRLHFYAGQSYVKLEYAVENASRSSPQYLHMFREAGLRHTLALGPRATLSAGGIAAQGQLEVASLALAPRQVGTLYQRDGTRALKGGRHVVASGGYEVGIGDEDGSTRAFAAGQRGRFVDVSDGEYGVGVAVRYFWEQAPRAISVAPDRLEIAVQADSPGHRSAPDRPAYDLDFGERSLHDLLYYFHRGDARTARVGALAEAFEYPLFARAPPAWYSDAGNWYFEIAREPDTARRRSGGDAHWMPDSIGVGRHGASRSFNSGGHHDSLSSAWRAFLSSGSLWEYERQLAISRWSIAHNPGWAYADNVIRFGEGPERYPAVDRALAAWNRLTAFAPKDFYVWKSDVPFVDQAADGRTVTRTGGRSYLNGYKVLPDMEHYGLFALFEYYHLTGDARALDAIHGFVNWDINFQHRHLFRGKMPSLEVTDLFARDPDALRRGHYSRIYVWMLYSNLAGFHATGSPVYDEFARWQIRRMLGLLRHRHGQLTGWKERPADAGQPVPQSFAQSWMEAMGVIALHEAYKTYDDERILDGLWAQADYFGHHVLYFPRLGMLNNRTGMPNRPLGHGEDKGATLTPHRHDWMVQAWPVLYHYSGWPAVAERYRAFERARSGSRIDERFVQTVRWEQENVAKSSAEPPEAVRDLRVIAAGRDGISLAWTSPRDDGPSGRAAHYFVKYSTRPIVEFAPTDNPERSAAKARIVRMVDELGTERRKGKRSSVHIAPGEAGTEDRGVLRSDPAWDKVDAFWMAEHVAGEPVPAPAGTEERFTMRELRPHQWFGAPEQPVVGSLARGTYYIAICSWDEDRNLSRVSNVVEVDLGR